MKTRKQKETGEKEVHLLEQKGYERMVNEIVPVQQAEAYRKPTNKAVKEAVKELCRKCVNTVRISGKAHLKNELFASAVKAMEQSCQSQRGKCHSRSHSRTIF